MKSKSWLLLLAFFVRLPVSGNASESYAILPGTESPDRHYAVAWGMKGVSDIQQADPLKGDPDAIENYIVDLTENKIITPLKTGYWHFQSKTPNYRTFEAKWSGNSAILVVLYTLRWGDLGSFEAFLLDGGKLAAELDLGKVIGMRFREYLAKSWPDYARRKNFIEPLYNNLSVEGGGVLAVNVIGGMPGDKSGDSYSEDTTVRFSVTSERPNSLHCQVLGTARAKHVIDPSLQPAEADEAKDEIEAPAPTATVAKATPSVQPSAPPNDRAVRADKHLNAAYKMLRSKLDATQQEKLRLEQRAWLLERDKIADEEEKTVFVEKRAVELEAQAQAR